jgi:hypothetical protein
LHCWVIRLESSRKLSRSIWIVLIICSSKTRNWITRIVCCRDKSKPKLPKMKVIKPKIIMRIIYHLLKNLGYLKSWKTKLVK